MLNKIASKYLAKIATDKFDPYETFDTLVKYHETGPDNGRSAKDSALYHLYLEFNKALAKEFAGTGNSIFKAGEPYSFGIGKTDAPLGSRLGLYASDIKETVHAFPDVKEMEIIWDAEGYPILLHDVIENRIKLNRAKYSHIDDIKDQAEFKKALAKALENQAFRFRAKRAPSAKENKENWAKTE